MLYGLLKELQNPEFWTSVAFFIVWLLFVPSVLRYLQKWGKKQALLVRKKIAESKKVKKDAADLLKKYQLIYNSKYEKKKQLLSEAKAEISFLERESIQKTEDRISRKKQEVELRLRMIEENGKQDVKNKMLNQIVCLTRKKMVEKQQANELCENMDATIDRVFAALDENEALLDKGI